MDTQIIESFGWLLLMFYFPILRISEKVSEKIYPFFLLIIPVIFFCFQNANYPFLLSSILAIFYLVIMFLVPTDNFLKKYIRLSEPREFLIFLTTAFVFLLVGIILKTYIFVISSYIYFVITFFQYISDFYLDAESPPTDSRGKYKFKSGLHLYIFPFSILFILESFGISDVFGVIDTVSIHWLYSTIAQVFSALFGINILIGVFILDKKVEKTLRDKLLHALKGFTILYIILIFISIMGIAIHHETDNESEIKANNIDLKLDTIIPAGSFEERQLPDSNQILYSGLFTIILTLIFSSFIYLNELIRIMFEWGSKIET